jgi:transcriptional antiterminator NusG
MSETADMKWFVVHTYSGFENKAKKSLEDRIKLESLQESFGQILVPTEQVVEMRDGQKRTMKRKTMPGYILVQMQMNPRTKSLVKNTPKVTGFLGSVGQEDPPPLRDEEVSRVTAQVTEGGLRAKPRVQYDTGDTVRVVDGPFANFNGSIEEVNPEKGRVRVLVSIFGRSTPVELDFMQIEKTQG